MSRTPEQFLLHVPTDIHACKQMGLDADFKEAKVALKTAILDLDIAKLEYSSKKKEAKEHKEKPPPSSEATSPVVVTKTTYEKAIKAIESTKLAITMTGANAFELFQNILFDKATGLGEDHPRPSDLCSLRRCIWGHAL